MHGSACLRPQIKLAVLIANSPNRWRCHRSGLPKMIEDDPARNILFDFKSVLGRSDRYLWPSYVFWDRRWVSSNEFWEKMWNVSAVCRAGVTGRSSSKSYSVKDETSNEIMAMIKLDNVTVAQTNWKPCSQQASPINIIAASFVSNSIRRISFDFNRTRMGFTRFFWVWLGFTWFS